MTIPALPSLDRTSATFKTDLDAFFLTQLPATIPAFNAEIERINLMAFGAYSATSSTSLSISTGSKSLTIETGKSFAIGQPVLIASTAAPANWMHGQVTAYDSGTGALTVNVVTVSGSGTAAAWSVSVTAAMASAPPTVLQRTITSADTLIAGDRGKLIDCSGTFTLAVTAAATLGDGWYCWLRNTSNGDVTVDPASTEQIDGAATLVLKPGFTVLVACNGTAFTTLKVKERTYTNIAGYTASGTLLVPADTYVIRGYAWGRGGDGTSAPSSGGGGGCAYGDIAVTPGETVTVTIASNTAKVITSATEMLTANPASGVTAGTASKHASVTNGGAYSGGAGQSGGIYGGASSGSPLGAGKSSGTARGGSSWGFGATKNDGAGLGEAFMPDTYGSGNVGGGGSRRHPGNLWTDPLLSPLTGDGGVQGPTYGAPGQPGGGGGSAASGSSGGSGGRGGVGCGGGASGTNGAGGDGGFGGGGGAGGTTSGEAGDGGLGGGGAGSSASYRAEGGAACVLIYY